MCKIIRVPDTPVEATKDYVRQWLRLLEAATVVSPGHPLFEVQIQKFGQAARRLQQETLHKDISWNLVLAEVYRQFRYLSQVTADQNITTSVERDIRRGHLPYVREDESCPK